MLFFIAYTLIPHPLTTFPIQLYCLAGGEMNDEDSKKLIAVLNSIDTTLKELVEVLIKISRNTPYIRKPGDRRE